MSQEWPNLPDWTGPAAAWLASVIAAGGAKPAFDWWQGRSRERREAEKELREAKREEVDAATELREEMRRELRSMRADLTERDDKIEAVQREMFELLAKVGALTAENQILRAQDHRLRSWVAGFYATIQMKWKLAGLPMDEVPTIPDWVHQSPDGPTASFRDSP